MYRNNEDVSTDEEILEEYKKILEAKVAKEKRQQDQVTEADCNPSTTYSRQCSQRH